MVPTNSGEVLTRIVQEGEINYEFSNALGIDWVINNLNTVAYIQNTNTKEIYQSGSTFN
jgi:hypothetical protein